MKLNTVTIGKTNTIIVIITNAKKKKLKFNGAAKKTTVSSVI